MMLQAKGPIPYANVTCIGNENGWKYDIKFNINILNCINIVNLLLL